MGLVGGGGHADALVTNEHEVMPVPDGMTFIDAAAIPSSPGRTPFSIDALAVLREFRPPVVSFHFGLPAPELLSQVKSLGAKVLGTATTLEEALWLEARGVDAVIAQGLEAGGHRGHFLSDDLGVQLGSFALVPQLVQRLRVPVIAAGGIADGRGVAAALTLGAVFAQVGTAYLLCPETTTHAVHRAALKSETAHHTALTNLFSGGAARGIVNRLMRELGPINAAAPAFPLAATAIVSRNEAVRERDLAREKTLTAQRTVEFVKSIFAVADPSESRGATITAREILNRGAAHIDQGLERDEYLGLLARHAA